MKKIISFLLATVCVLLSLSSCSSKIAMPKPSDDRVVLTVGGEKIYYDYFRYVFLNTKADMDGGDENYWEENPDAIDELKASTLETILRNRAISLLAKEYKVSLSKDEKKEINEYLNELKEYDSYKDNLEASYMTEYTFVYVQRFTTLWSKIYDHITNIENGVIEYDDSDVLEDIPVNFRRIRYIMIEYDETDKEEKKALIEDAYGKAVSGEDFGILIEKYCEDDYMLSIVDDGYYYTVTSIVEEIEKAVEKLEAGQISDIVELSYAYFVIQRLDIDMEFVNNNLAEFADMYTARLFNEMVSEIQADIEIEYTDLWKNASVSNVK